MANYEYYSSGEFVVQGQEYRHFEAEVYQKPQEIKMDIPEITPTGEESRFAQPPTPPATPQGKQKVVTREGGEKRSKLKHLFETISKSTTRVIGTVVGAVAAATSVVVVCSGFFTSAPEVAPIYVEGGGNYVSYALDIQDLDEQVDYDIVVSTPFDQQTFVKEEVVEGRNEHVFLGLRPGYEYTLSLVGEGQDATGEVTYYKTTFYTDKDGVMLEPTYGASFDPVPAKDAYVKWGDETHQITLPLAYHPDENGLCGYRIRLKNKNGEIITEYVGQEEAPTFEVSAQEDEVFIQYDAVGVVDGKAVFVYDTFVMDEPFYLGMPTFTFLNQKTLAATGHYRVPFQLESKVPYEQVQDGSLIVIQTSEGEEQVTLDNLLSNKLYYLDVYTDGTPGTFTLNASVTVAGPYGGEPRVIETPTVTYENQFEIRPNVYFLYTLYGQAVHFEYAVCAPAGTYLSLIDTKTGEPIEVTDFYHEIEATEGQYAYTYQFMSQDGAPLTQIESVAFDTSLKPDYYMECPNPGDLLVTYNEDGTMNIYFDISFECEDEDTFYELVVRSSGGKEYLFRDRKEIYVAEGLPFDDYYLTYRVVCVKDGARYVLKETVPSGGVEPLLWSGVEFVPDGTTLTLHLPESHLLGDTFTLVINGDHVIQFSKEDLTQEEYGSIYTVDAGVEVVSAHLTLTSCPKIALYEIICDKIGAEQIKGSIYRLEEVEMGE